MSGTAIRRLFTTSSGGSGFVQDTYANIAALMGTSSLVEGSHYEITDRADGGIVLLAVSTNQLSLEGEGIFLNPDFQFVGNYSGILGYDVTIGVWFGSNEGSYSLNQVVFWDGLHYLITDDSMFDGTNPGTNSAAYTILPKTNANVGYIIEIDFIHYDFSNDRIIWQEDKRGNTWNPYNVTSFQRGNDDAVGMYIHPSNADIDIINQRGSIDNVIIQSGALNLTETHVGLINTCLIRNTRLSNTDYNLENCVFNIDLVIDIQDDANGKQIDSLGSTFEMSLNMTTAFLGGTLTIPVNLNYIGIFTLENEDASSINRIDNISEPVPVKFYVEAGNTQDFVHAAVAFAGFHRLVSDAALTNTVKGTAGGQGGKDWLSYRLVGNLNQREDGVILI